MSIGQKPAAVFGMHFMGGRAPLVASRGFGFTVPTATKFYFECPLINGQGLSQLMVGIGNAAFILVDPIDTAVNANPPSQANCAVSSFPLPPASLGIGWGYPTRFQGNVITIDANADVIGVAFDITLGGLKVWMRNTKHPTVWAGNGGASPDPSTGTNGFDAGTQIPGPVFITAGTSKNWNDGNVVPVVLDLNAGATAFAGTLPTGYQAFDASGTTTFSPSDHDPRITLSNGNLRLTTTMPSPFGTPPFSHVAMARSNTSKYR